MSVLKQIASSQFYLGETADFGMLKGYIDSVIHKMNRCFSHVRELKDVPEKGSYTLANCICTGKLVCQS